MMSRIKGIFAPVLLLAVCFGVAAHADTAESAQAVVKSVTDDVLAKLKQSKEEIKADPGKVYELVNEIVVPHFDSVAMARLVLGKHWRNTSKEQKLEFIDQFRNLLVRTYGTALANYTDEKIEYDATRVDPKGTKAKVRTRILPAAGGPDIPIAYSLRLTDGQWRVYDVAIDGISMVNNYRSGFSQRINQSGMDGLLARLKERNSG